MRFLTIIILTFISACSFSRKTESDYYLLLGDGHKCSKKYFEEDENIIQEIERVSTEGAGYVVSYTLVGTAYTGEVLVRFVGGVAAGIVVCSPIIAVEGALGGGGDVSGRCIGEVGGKLMESEKLKWGDHVHEDTRKMRCPEVDHISKGVRRVAKCYLKNNKSKKAHKQIMSLLSDREIIRCVSKNGKNKLNKLLRASRSST